MHYVKEQMVISGGAPGGGQQEPCYSVLAAVTESVRPGPAA